MLQSWIPFPRYARGGVRRVLIAPWSEGLRLVRSISSRQSVVTAISPTLSWTRIGCSDRAQASQQHSYTKNGPLFSQRTVFVFTAGLLPAQLPALTPYLKQPLVVLFQDEQGSWWLAGSRRGLRATIKSETAVENGETLETLQLDGTEPLAWQPFYISAAETLYADAPNTIDIDPDPAPGGGGDGGGDDF